MPADYDKPKIEIRNYYLKWNAESYGIPQKEINELKKFLTDAIPFSGTSYELLNSFEKARYKDILVNISSSTFLGHIAPYGCPTD